MPRKSLTVLVVGESARAENFGILGYGRDTTPKLDKEAGLIAFTDVHSCGTETAVSVPCMFSNMGRKDYDASKAKNEEGLLDVLKRAGIDVIWRDNQSGCKGTCDRVTLQDVSNLKDPALCANSECRDEILLQGLQQLYRPPGQGHRSSSAPDGQSRPGILQALSKGIRALHPGV